MFGGRVSLCTTHSQMTDSGISGQFSYFHLPSHHKEAEVRNACPHSWLFFFNVHFGSQLRLSWRLVRLMVLSTEPPAQLLQWVLFVCFIKTLTFPQLSEQFFSLFMCVMHFEHFYVIMYIINITYLLVALYRLYFYLILIFFLKLLCSLFWSYVSPPPNPLRFSPPPYPPNFVFFSLNNLKK